MTLEVEGLLDLLEKQVVQDRWDRLACGVILELGDRLESTGRLASPVIQVHLGRRARWDSGDPQVHQGRLARLDIRVFAAT